MAASVPPTLHRTHSQTGTLVHVNYKTKYGLVVSDTTPSEPRTVSQALADPRWKQAMLEEIGALHKNRTWHLVPSQPGTHVIDEGNMP